MRRLLEVQEPFGRQKVLAGGTMPPLPPPWMASSTQDVALREGRKTASHGWRAEIPADRMDAEAAGAAAGKDAGRRGVACAARLGQAALKGVWGVIPPENRARSHGWRRPAFGVRGSQLAASLSARAVVCVRFLRSRDRP